MPVLVSLALSTPDNPLVATSVQSPAQLLSLRLVLSPRGLGKGGGVDLAMALRSDLPSSLFRLCAMRGLGACPSPALLPGILQPTTSRRLQQLMVCHSVALALSVRPAPFSPWSTLSSPLAVHAIFSVIFARCVHSQLSRQHCCICAWCCPHVAWVRGGGVFGPCD